MWQMIGGGLWFYAGGACVMLIIAFQNFAPYDGILPAAGKSLFVAALWPVFVLAGSFH